MNSLVKYRKLINVISVVNRVSPLSFVECDNAFHHNDFTRARVKHVLRRFSLKTCESRLIFPSLNDGQLLTIRSYAKSMDKGKDKKKSGKPKVMLDDEDMEKVIPIDELRIELNKIVTQFKDDLIHNVSLRSNIQAIENLKVEMSGAMYELKELAQISRKNPNLVVLSLSSMPDAIKPILMAISLSGISVNPQQEGTTIYIPIPKVTREHREAMVKNAKMLFNRTKDSLSKTFSSFSGYAKKQKKSGVSDELVYNVCENLKHLIDSKIVECEKILNQKVNELIGE